MHSLTIYTDGACSGNPGPGGWAAVLIYGEHKKEMSGFEAMTTNNRMELTAAIKALQALNRTCEVDVYTDSAYLCNAFLNGWIESWIKRGWLKADKKPVENSDLWRELVNLSQIHNIKWHKVKGHSCNELNNLCDKLATDQIKLNAE